jgi:hypothetical protein
LGGGETGPGMVVEGGHRSQKRLLSHPKYTKMAKTGGFAHVSAEKSAKMPFFAQKFLTRYTHEMFLRNTSILKLYIT